MSNTDALTKAIQLLKDQTPRILELEQQVEPSERDAALLRAFGRVACACAKQKGIATAGSDKPSEIIRKLVPLTPLQPRITQEAARKARRAADEKALADLRAIAAKGNAFDPSIRADLAAVLLAIARERGIAIAAGASPEEMLERIKPILLAQGLIPKIVLQ